MLSCPTAPGAQKTRIFPGTMLPSVEREEVKRAGHGRHTPVVSGTQEAEAGGSLGPRSSRQHSEVLSHFKTKVEMQERHLAFCSLSPSSHLISLCS
jgi:hypothetical protein